MIVVRVELWPGGDSRPLRQIAGLGVVNVGPDSDGFHAYQARADGRIAHLRHRQADGALMLVAKAILALAESAEPDPRAASEADLAELIAERWGALEAVNPTAAGRGEASDGR